ncbi:MAG: hypothetical protein FWC56_01080, partial [Phycisphaerae bacterium]|nr:hypothetical protein [Phycisphaerae bacterium]
MELVSEVGQILRSSTPAWLVDDVAAVGSVEPNRPLAPLTRYRLGGPADWFARPSSVAQLTTLVARCR